MPTPNQTPASAPAEGSRHTPAEQWVAANQLRANRVEIWTAENNGQHREQICEVYVDGKGRNVDRVALICAAPTLQAENEALLDALAALRPFASVDAFRGPASDDWEYATKLADLLLTTAKQGGAA